MNKVVSRSLTLVASLAFLNGCGALFSEEAGEDEIFDFPIDGLTDAQLTTFLAGDEAFGTFYTAEMGLGPVFNAPACKACHPGEGRGHPSFNFTRFGRGDGPDADSFDYLEELGGPQLQTHAIAGYPAETLPPDVESSVRTGPVVVGLGLLEAVPAETILALADPDDEDGDGISGRANYVVPPDFIEIDPTCSCIECKQTESGCKLMGRFGRKARSINLLHQAARALHDDIGITSDFFSEDVFNPLVGGPSGDAVPDPEVAADTLNSLTFYLRTLRPPMRRDAADAQVLKGEALFDDIGCTACHVAQLTTGPSSIEALANQPVAAYTDMLVHDMGSNLADGVPDEEASGSEWRTTPLWGIGIIDGQLGGDQFYMHDGRARTLDEAIILHGGEAAQSSAAFALLSASDREAVFAFLRSL